MADDFAEQDSGPFPEGPMSNPVDRFIHLPKETRVWLEQLRPGDIAEIHDAVVFYRTAKTVGKWNIKIIALIVSLFIGTVAFVAAVKTARGWFS